MATGEAAWERYPFYIEKEAPNFKFGCYVDHSDGSWFSAVSLLSSTMNRTTADRISINLTSTVSGQPIDCVILIDAQYWRATQVAAKTFVTYMMLSEWYDGSASFAATHNQSVPVFIWGASKVFDFGTMAASRKMVLVWPVIPNPKKPDFWPMFIDEIYGERGGSYGNGLLGG